MIQNKSIKNIKLVVSDLDGTLLNNDGQLGAKTIRMINELVNRDIIFCIATGRLHSSVVPVAEQLSLNGPIISLDGALIRYHNKEKIIFESFLKTKYVKKAIKFSDDYRVNIVLCHSDAIFYTEDNSVIPLLLSKYGAEYKKVDSYLPYINKTLEIVCSSDLKETLKRMYDMFRFPATFGCSTSFFKSHTHDNIFYLEIRKAGSNKGKGLLRVLKYLNIKPHDTAVIGDWYNDIPLFQVNAYKVAVANAIPELLSKADFVTKHNNNEEGAADFFEMLLEENKDRSK